MSIWARSEVNGAVKVVLSDLTLCRDKPRGFLVEHFFLVLHPSLQTPPRLPAVPQGHLPEAVLPISLADRKLYSCQKSGSFPSYFLLSGMASSWIKRAVVATASMEEMTGTCRRGRREKAGLSFLAAEDSLGSAKLMG